MRDRQGWKALGYESFVEYGKKSLGYDKSHIYELADAGEIGLQIGFSAIAENQPKESGGWSREAVKNYKSLQKIDEDAWEIITGTMDSVIQQDDDAVIDDITGVIKAKFSENLLRNILDLDAGQQVVVTATAPDLVASY